MNGITRLNTAGAQEIKNNDIESLKRRVYLLEGQEPVASTILSVLTAYAGFREAVEDYIGGDLVDSATVDFTYNDATPSITASVKTDSVDNTYLANMAQATVKGRAAAAGTGDPTDLTPAQLVSILASADGAGSGLDADLLDGLSSTAFAILAGQSGGQTLNGDTASGGNLTLKSTAHATKGKILFGTSAYDEANNRLGIGTASPSYTLDVAGSMRLGTANSIIDSVFLLNGPLEFSPNTAQDYRGQFEVDSSTLYFCSNEYYAGGWQLYDTGRAPAKITITSSSADSNIKFYTKAANTAQSTLAATIDKSGNLTMAGTIKTTLSSAWDLGGYTATAPAATGYVTIKIGGTTYKLLAST